MKIIDSIKNKPFYLLMVIALFFLVLSFVQQKEETFDINIHDTYFVIANNHLSRFYFLYFSLLFLSLWFLHKREFLRRNLLEKIYVFGTILLFLLFNYWNSFFALFQNGNEIYDSWLIDVNTVIVISFFLFVILQIIWLIYWVFVIIKGLLKKPL